MLWSTGLILPLINLSFIATTFLVFSLNILAVRRHIVADIRGVLSDSEEEYPVDAPVDDEVAPLSYQKLVGSSMPDLTSYYLPQIILI